MSTPDKTSTDPSPFANSLVTIHFSAPDFTVHSPDDISEKVTPEPTIFSWGGVKIARISPNIAVKFGSHFTLSEAKSMIFVDQNTETVPVPKIFAYYTYGPIDRDISDYGSLFDTYIFMDLVEGQTLDKVWDIYDEGMKARVANQLKWVFLRASLDTCTWIYRIG